MLFCCLWRNVETSCHKQFVVINKRCRLLPAISVNLPRSGGVVLITPSRSQRWQHAMEPDIGSESRFLSTLPAFDAPVRMVLVGILPCRLVRKNWNGLSDGEKILKIRLFLSTESTNVTDGQTYGRTDTAWRHRPRLHSIARQKL